MNQTPTTDDERPKYVMPINRVNPIPFAIGIDPDISKSGFAVWNRAQKKHTLIDAVEFWVVLDRINRITPGQAEFYIDAGWLNKGYHHYDNLPDDFDTWSEKSKRGYLISLGVDVGRNFAVGQVLVHYLKAHKHLVHEVQPVTEKWSAADLKRYTGWTKRTNQDARDSAKLCFGR